jgi:hypothetical protein
VDVAAAARAPGVRPGITCMSRLLGDEGIR